MSSPSSTTFKLSPMETEREILAMELVVGLMYERDLDLVGVVMSLGRVVVGLVSETEGRERRGLSEVWGCGWTSLEGRLDVWTMSADQKREGAGD